MSPRTHPASTARIGPALAGLGSLLAVIVGCWWLLRPDSHAFAFDPDPMSLPSALPGIVSSGALVLLGTTGLLALLIARVSGSISGPGAHGGNSRSSRLLVGVALIECLGFTVLIADASLLMAMGYLTAVMIPFALVITAILTCRRSTMMRWITAAGIAAVALWAVIAPTITWTTVPDLIMELVQLLLPVPVADLLLAAFAMTAIGWGVIVRHLLVGTVVVSRANAVVSRIGVVATWVAAASPLPYLLLRLTWLTPWVQFGPSDMSGDLRLWGLLLSGGALLGSVLTIGLLCRWGQVFPAWMPIIGGRRVPVPAAVVPATVVGLAVTVAAGPMIAGAIASGNASALLENLIVFPFWLWGPSLLIATWAYALRRRQPSATVARKLHPADAR